MRPDRKPHGVRHAHRAAVTGWLWLLWVVLWGDLTALVVLGGLLTALAVTFAFPLPPVTRHTALRRPVAMARLFGHLAADIVLSGAEVAWEAVRHGRRPRAAVIETPVRVDTDLLVTATANLTTLTPGTLVLEIDRRGRLLYVHTLPVPDPAAVEQRRHAAQRAEDRLLRAVRPAPTDRARPEGPHRKEDTP